MSNFEDYSDLAGNSIGIPKKEISPEEEFFHSIYICGRDRENHKQIIETNGKLQIRGVDYNKDEVHMIITHVRKIRVNSKFDVSTQKNTVTCSSKLNTDPWVGSSGRKCPSSLERAKIPECAECKHQILVFGLLCENKEGKLKIGENGKPMFCFFVGRGIKWEDVNKYLTDEAQKEITPIFNPPSEKSLKFEKENIDNSKRVVTSIKVGHKRSNYNNNLLQTFQLESISKLSNKQVLSLVEVVKKVLPQIDEKIGRLTTISTRRTDGIVNDKLLTMEDVPSMENTDKPVIKEEVKQPEVKENNNFSFEDMNLDF